MLFAKSGHLTEKVKFMSDYETFMIILTVANLIVAILTYAHKNSRPDLGELTAIF